MDVMSQSQGGRGESRFDQTRHLGRKPVTLSAIGDMLRRRWQLLAVIVLITTAAAIVAALLITPKYDATTRIRIIPVGQSPLDFDSNKDSPLDMAVLNTEVTTIRSRDVARKVVISNDLQDDPEFMKGYVAVAGSPPEIAKARAVEAATSAVLGHLDVEQQDKSYVILIGFRSIDAAKAAQLSNAFATAYIDNSADTMMDTAARQAASTQSRLTELGQNVEQADARVAQYRSQSGIVQGGGNGTITDQQVAPLSMELATAESDAAAARSKVQVAQQQISAGGTDAVSAVLSSSVIGDLRRQRTEAEKQRAQLNARYGPKFPDVVQSQQQIEALDSQIREEAQRIIGGLKSEASAADARASSLRSQLAALKGSISQDTRAAVTADSLQRQADAQRAAYNRLAEAGQQYSQAERSSEPQARILERATIASRPSYPNKPAMAAAGILIGLIGGFATVLLREGTQATIRRPEDVETLLGIKFLASVQELSARQLKADDGAARSPAGTLLTTPVSAYSEAFRTMRNAVRPTDGAIAKIVSISSTLPAEGKTTSALSLARVMALSGERVLLVDCDIRRAGLRRATQIKSTVGLVEVLSGVVAAEAAIVADAVTGLDLLPVAKPTFTPVDMFSGDTMRKLLDSLRARYDHIILDTPPLLGIADARTLSMLADAVLLVIKWNSTPIPAIDAALAGIEHDNAPLLGAVLTMVDSRAEAMGALYYSARYSQYYQQE